MINNGIINETETNASDEFRSFQIKATPEMFDMLSRKIYTNEKLAIIRELTTNGIDSMIEAGTINDKKLLVHLPDWNDPELRIRDFGTGLDDDGMVKVYTYGDTSRNTSNNYVGSFGIGSKSPFAYGDSGFEIISYFNGRQLTYNACKINGIPQIIKLSEDETNEPNGVEVKLAVSENDFYKFKDEAKKFYAWFNYPVDINLTELEWRKEDYIRKEQIILDKPTYTLYPSNCNIFKNLRVEVYMGGILYELPSIFQRTVSQNILTNVSIILKVPVGTFSLPPSREQISGTDENRIKLIELLTYVRKDMLDSFFEEDKKFIQSKNFSNNEIICYLMSTKWKRSDLIHLNTSLYSYNDDYAIIRDSYIKIIEKEYPWFSELLKKYNINDADQGFKKHMPIPDTDELYLLWDLPKIPNSRVQIVTSHKKAQNYGDVLFIKNTTTIQWRKFLTLHAPDGRFFSCEIYKRISRPDIKDPNIIRYDYELQNLKKLDSKVYDSVKKMAMEYFGMREDQIVLSSEFNKMYPLPKNTEVKVNALHTREKVEDASLLAKKLSRNSYDSDSYFETYQSSQLSNSLVYVYEGNIKDAEYVICEKVFETLKGINYELLKEGKITESEAKHEIFLVQKRFEKKLPKDAIHIKAYIEDFLKSHEIMSLTDKTELEKNSYYYGEYRSKEFPYIIFLRYYENKLALPENKDKFINEDRIKLIKLNEIILNHIEDMKILKKFIDLQFIPSLKITLERLHIDFTNTVKFKKFTIPDLDKWIKDYPIAYKFFSEGIYDSYPRDSLYELLAYEKLDESKILLPYNNLLHG